MELTLPLPIRHPAAYLEWSDELPSLLVMVAIAAAAFAPVPVRTAGVQSPVQVFQAADPELGAALDRIARGSPSWRMAMTAVAATGRTAVVLTPDQVVVLDASSPSLRPFDRSDRRGGVAGGRWQRQRLRRCWWWSTSSECRRCTNVLRRLPGEFHADLERVLAHEVYGHAVPYLLAGHVSGRCADPAPGMPATDACAIQRENVVRGELRLGRRTDGALSSLALARRSRD